MRTRSRLEQASRPLILAVGGSGALTREHLRAQLNDLCLVPTERNENGFPIRRALRPALVVIPLVASYKELDYPIIREAISWAEWADVDYKLILTPHIAPTAVIEVHKAAALSTDFVTEVPPVLAEYLASRAHDHEVIFAMARSEHDTTGSPLDLLLTAVLAARIPVRDCLMGFQPHTITPPKETPGFQGYSLDEELQKPDTATTPGTGSMFARAAGLISTKKESFSAEIPTLATIYGMFEPLDQFIQKLPADTNTQFAQDTLRSCLGYLLKSVAVAHLMKG